MQPRDIYQFQYFKNNATSLIYTANDFFKYTASRSGRTFNGFSLLCTFC